MGDVIEPKKEQKDHSLIMIFLVIVIISFVSGLLERFPIFYWNIDSIQNIQNYQFYTSIFLILSIIVNPFLVFIGFYKIGKKFDLKSNLKSLIIRLLSGGFLGFFISYNVAYLIIGIDSIWFDSYLSIFIGSVFSLAFLRTFFVAFTALAIAYLKQNESEFQ